MAQAPKMSPAEITQALHNLANRIEQGICEPQYLAVVPLSVGMSSTGLGTVTSFSMEFEGIEIREPEVVTHAQHN